MHCQVKKPGKKARTIEMNNEWRGGTERKRKGDGREKTRCDRGDW